jgi:hypothetical protein
MKPSSKRAIAVPGVAILAAVVLAACGGSSPPTTTSTSSSAAASAAPSTGSGTPAPAAGGQFAAERAKLATCLKKYGVTLPSFAGGAGRFAGATGGAGAFRRRFGATGATGARRFFGATGARGFPGTGRPPGGAGGFASNPAFAKALAACGGFGGFGGGRFGASGASAAPNPATSATYRAEIVSYAACMKTNGVALPKPNFSGKGFVFGTTVNQHTSAFVAANAKCRSLITTTAPAG